MARAISKTCIICTNEANDFAKDSFMETPVYHCTTCDYYFNDLLGVTDIGKYYDDQYWKKVRKKKNILQITLKKLSGIYHLFAQLFSLSPVELGSNLKILAPFKSLSAGDTVLEIGAGMGKNMNYFKWNKWNMNAVEPDSINAGKINSKFGDGTCYCGPYEKSTFDQKFDLIYLRHVLEHFEDLDEVLLKMKSDLKQDGVVYVNVPNCKCSKWLNHSVVNHPHTFHYSAKSLTTLFSKHGFNVLFSGTYDHKVKGLKSNLYEVLSKSNLQEVAEKEAEFLVVIAQKTTGN